MDNLINILRKATTPKEGVSSDNTYDNGAGFFNPLAWVVEDGEDMDGFPSGLYVPPAAKKETEDTTELRKKVRDASNGAGTVDSSITNAQALENLENMVALIRDYGDGALLPKRVTISDNRVSKRKMPSNVYGWFIPSEKKIELKDTNDDPYNALVMSYNAEAGHHPNNDGRNTIPLHELGHAAQDAVDYMYEQQGPNALLDRLRLMQSEPSAEDARGSLREQAATANGYNDPQEADKTISEYATTDALESFAEAFVDVLINGENAAPYAQSLVQLYLQEANRKRGRIDDYRSQDPFERETTYARMGNILNNRSTLNP